MNLTIRLGQELSKITNSITDVFTTKDYFQELSTQYEAHVINLYDKDFSNDFTRIYDTLEVLYEKRVTLTPCDTPLDDIGTVEEDLLHIVDNRSAYTPILNIFLGHCKNDNSVSPLVYDLIDTLKRDSKSFTECALKYDRHAGNVLPVSMIIQAITSYGRLSGMIDYYNFNEGKDDY